MDNYKNFKRKLLKAKEAKKAYANLGTEFILGSKSKRTIPLDIQHRYIQYHNLVDSHGLPETVLFAQSSKLFSSKMDLDEKKKLLYLLAHNSSLQAHELLKKYLKKPDKQLKAWAELCLQEFAGHLGSELLNQDETFMVMGGAGGDGQRLRYYFIFSSINFRPFTVAQKLVIKKSTQAVDKKLKGKTESLNFGKDYFLASVLLPMDVSAEMYFQEMYNAVNGKKEVIHYHYYCNNVLKPTSKDIKEYLSQIQ